METLCPGLELERLWEPQDSEVREGEDGGMRCHERALTESALGADVGLQARTSELRSGGRRWARQAAVPSSFV